MAVSDWTEEEERQLRDLWDSGARTARLVAQLGRTRNAILGKVHRMGLSSRPCPIGMTGEQRASLGIIVTRRKPAPPRQRSVNAPVPSKRAVALDRARTAGLTGSEASMRQRREEAYRREGLIAAPPPRAHRPFGDFGAAATHYPADMGCQWIHGDVDTPGWRFCDAPRETNRPYCPAHCCRAYATASRLEAQAP